jgi:molecular chaperone DnaJ
LRVPGKGEAGDPGTAPGDLYVVVRVPDRPPFHREGRDIVLDWPITFPRAALGGEVEVPTLDGAARLRVPPGTQTHTLFRLRGKGLPDLESGRRGDQLVRVIVATPERLSTEERRLLEKLNDLLGDYARASKPSFFDRFH